MGLTIDQAKDIWAKFVVRRERFPNETEEMSMMVVLMNYGDQFTHIHCIHGEWSGTKGMLQPSSGIPVCPNGHVLLESGNRVRLGFVPETLG